jgi:ketosteroid isomerase-like protein
VTANGSTELNGPVERYGALIQRFGESWEGGAGEEIADLFVDDGVFVPGPFDPPVRGSEAIREYWKDIPLEQAEISFRFGEIYPAGPWFATEIRCTFRRRRKGEMVDIRGALFCETRDGKIAEMRMYWHRITR